MIALVDCNSFFCSVEKVFHPGLNGKPVCVLSCNDGCIIALTPEAKALGLCRGDPIFQEKGGSGTVWRQTVFYKHDALCGHVEAGEQHFAVVCTSFGNLFDR